MFILEKSNKVRFIGVFQLFSDAIKRFTREQYFPLVSNYLSYYFSPIFGLFLHLLVWILILYIYIYMKHKQTLFGVLPLHMRHVFTAAIFSCVHLQ